MNQIVIEAVGGPDQFHLRQNNTDILPGPHEVLVNVEAAGVNFIDVMHRTGALPVPLPFTPGLEGVGRVAAVGDGVDQLALGQRVAWINVRGSYADRVRVPAAQAIPVPDSFEATQALLFQAMTAQYLATEYRAVGPGDRVLVHAAAGGVGQLLVQWLKHLGAWVVGTVSSEPKAEVARAAGADAVINYGPDYVFADELKALTGGAGVDLAFDSVGKATLQATVRSLARGGTAVSCGASSGPAPLINPMDLMAPCTRLAGGNVFTINANPVELQRRAATVVHAVKEGWLTLPQGTAFPLDHAAAAHRALEGRSVVAKLYLTP